MYCRCHYRRSFNGQEPLPTRNARHFAGMDDEQQRQTARKGGETSAREQQRDSQGQFDGSRGSSGSGNQGSSGNQRLGTSGQQGGKSQAGASNREALAVEAAPTGSQPARGALGWRPSFCPRTIQCGAIPSEFRRDPPRRGEARSLRRRHFHLVCSLPLAPPRYSVALPRRSPPVPSHRTRAKETPYPPPIEVDLVPRRGSTCYGPTARLDDLGPRLAHA